MPRLIELLGDESYVIRRKAALALGQLDDEAAVGALLRSIEDPSDYVVESAAWALQRIARRDFGTSELRAETYDNRDFDADRTRAAVRAWAAEK